MSRKRESMNIYTIYWNHVAFIFYYRYVLPNHMLFDISRKMPVDPPGVLACCNPPPTLVRIYATDIAMVIKKVVTDVKPDDKSMEPEDLRNLKTLSISSKGGFIEDVEMEDIESLIKSKSTFRFIKNFFGQKSF